MRASERAREREGEREGEREREGEGEGEGEGESTCFFDFGWHLKTSFIHVATDVFKYTGLGGEEKQELKEMVSEPPHLHCPKMMTSLTSEFVALIVESLSWNMFISREMKQSIIAQQVTRTLNSNTNLSSAGLLMSLDVMYIFGLELVCVRMRG